MGTNGLAEVERIAREAQADSIAQEARALAERAAEGRFYVAVLGQFKRGKSTLLNALLDAPLLPAGVVPVTSVPTIVRWGERAARVRQSDSTWHTIRAEALADYVSEERNPGNARQVQAVEVFAPAPLLASGLCFVDTPGLGSVFEANDATTRAFVPHIDAAILVLGADPPISGEELRLAEAVGRDVATLVFVLNKADRATEEERAEAARFTERVARERLGRPIGRVFHVSALGRLTGGGSQWDWEPFAAHLQDLAQKSKRGLVAEAVRRGAARLSERLDAALSEEIAALQRPLDETEQRLSALRVAARDAERSLLDLSPLFAAEERRLGDLFAERRTVFMKTALPAALASLDDGLPGLGRSRGPALRRDALLLARQTAMGQVMPWLEESEREAEAAFRGAAARFTDITNGLLDRLKAVDPWAAALLPPEMTGERWDTRRRFLFNSFLHLSSPAGIAPAFRWLADLLLPRAIVQQHVERDARQFLRRLMETNAARVENDIKERVREARRQAEGQVRAVLTSVYQTVERAIERARSTQMQGQRSVQEELTRLNRLRVSIGSVQRGEKPQ